MRLIFFGTSEFACPALRALSREHEIVLVVTQPDRPAGRRAQLRPSPVKELATELNLSLIQPKTINEPGAVKQLLDCHADAIVVASYGQLLRPVVFDIPPMGTINIHASLLPAYRGAAPVQWAIIRGEVRTGISTFFIEKGLDTGDVLLMDALDIGPEETAAELEVRLAELGAKTILKTLTGLRDGTLTASPQSAQGVSLAPCLTRQHGRIDWNQPALQIHNLVRGTVPWPGAWTQLDDRRVKIHRTAVTDLTSGILAPGKVGPVESGRLLVGTQDKLLEVLELQREGRSRVAGLDFLCSLQSGSIFT